jgi:ankyrin repeat protein
VEVNARANNDVTPLGAALQQNNKDIADLLRKHGAQE